MMPIPGFLEAQDSVLAGKAFADEVFAEFIKEWLGGVGEQAMQLAWANVPPKQKEALKKADPEKYDELVKSIEIVPSEGV